MNNIMLDLETLGTDSQSVILSVGAVYFDKESIGDSFYRVLSVADQEKAGRTKSMDTITWWAQQSTEARKIFTEPQTPVYQVLGEFDTFARAYDPELCMWGNGADFDCVLWGSLYASFALKKPWSYSRNRCFRTLKNLFVPYGMPSRQGTHHNALDDAVYQAKCAQQYLKGGPIGDFR